MYSRKTIHKICIRCRCAHEKDETNLVFFGILLESPPFIFQQRNLFWHCTDGITVVESTGASMLNRVMSNNLRVEGRGKEKN